LKLIQTKTNIPKVLSGVSGEYFVAGELSRRGYIASITLRNTRGIDILVTNSDASKSVGIQVKTNQNSTRSWMLNEKVETIISDEEGEYLAAWESLGLYIVAE